MWSIGARQPKDEKDQPCAALAERVRGICGPDVTPRFHDDGSFSIRVEQEEEARRIQELLSSAGFRMRDRRPWRCETYVQESKPAAEIVQTRSGIARVLRFFGLHS